MTEQFHEMENPVPFLQFFVCVSGNWEGAVSHSDVLGLFAWKAPASMHLAAAGTSLRLSLVLRPGMLSDDEPSNNPQWLGSEMQNHTTGGFLSVFSSQHNHHHNS
jgi:hypothetical protein